MPRKLHNNIYNYLKSLKTYLLSKLRTVLKKTKSINLQPFLKTLSSLLKKINPVPLLKKISFPKLDKKVLKIAAPAIILILISSLIWLFKDVPNPTKLTRYPAPVSTQILDRNGELLYEIYTDKNRTPIQIEDMPDHLMKATIAIEDQRFYQHHGLDLKGITRAAFKTLTGQRLEGGSTITQQLIKTALLNDSSRTLTRKAREAILAIITEVIYSKDQILEMYLNHAPYGGTAYGIESAAHQYFNKPASQLNLSEASLLAGLPQAPTRYSPFGAHPELAKSRQKQVLRRMYQDGYISQEQLDTTSNKPLEYNQPEKSIKAPHFVLWVKDILVERYGEDKVNLGGLRVTTSLDYDLQAAAQASLSAEIEDLQRLRVGNGAALVTKPPTGEVLAMIGSHDYFDTENDGNVNITIRFRQPGSSIKPINYAVGLLKGWPTSNMYIDIPTCFAVTGQKAYCPRNYDATFHGPVQMRFALGNSYNLPAVKQLALNGVESMIATASAMGIKGWDDPSQYGLSLTLGGGEVRMVDMAVAFGSFANGGVKVPLNPILKVEDYQGEIIEQVDIEEISELASSQRLSWEQFKSNPPDPQSEKPVAVLPEEVAYIISHILLDNNARQSAFGSSSQLVIPGQTVSVKTGTTNDLRDNWTIGFTPNLLVSTWVGNNDNTPMSYVASGVTGASPIWNDITSYALKDKKDQPPKQPQGVVSQQVCVLTGLLPSGDNDCETRTELFIEDSLPLPNYSTQKQIWVKRDTKLPPQPNEEVIDLDLETHLVVSDPFIKDFCLDCPYTVETKPNPDNLEELIPTGKTQYPRYTINYDAFKASSITPANWLQIEPPHTISE